MMMSTYFKGKDFTRVDAWKNLDGRLKEELLPRLREIQRSNSGTYFYKTGLESSWIN